MIKKISSLTILKLGCVLMILAFPIFSIWGKNQCHYIDIDCFVETVEYNPLNDEVSGHDAMVLDTIYPSEDEIQNLDDLINISEAVAIVEMNSYDFSGPDILASCKIVEVVKGNGIHKNEMIEIYDHTWVVSVGDVEETAVEGWVGYFKDNVPLQKKEKYIVFIQKAINPIKEDTWMYSTYSYGNFRIKENPSIYEYSYDLENKDNNLTLVQASEYDLIYNADLGPIPINEKKVQLYKEIYHRFKDYVNK